MNGSAIRSRRVGDPTRFPRPRSAARTARSLIRASVFNISAMSFGSLSANAIRALNGGAKLGGFAHDTGEGSYSLYHREVGGDVIWEIGSGYFGCRTPDGGFDAGEIRRHRPPNPQIKMIEIKLSQGAKPGHGGVLPAPRSPRKSPPFAAFRSGAIACRRRSHSAFSTPLEMMAFIEAAAPALRRQAGRIQALHRPPEGVHGASSRPCWRPA